MSASRITATVVAVIAAAFALATPAHASHGGPTPVVTDVAGTWYLGAQPLEIEPLDADEMTIVVRNVTPLAFDKCEHPAGSVLVTASRTIRPDGTSTKWAGIHRWLDPLTCLPATPLDRPGSCTKWQVRDLARCRTTYLHGGAPRTADHYQRLYLCSWRASGQACKKLARKPALKLKHYHRIGRIRLREGLVG